ncbi:thioredoxin domain-containing protein [Alteromonas sp. 345S023]|uniref:Thioredoxin domain-containing protein n=1 Tax=Alteromonas profundi TaxID=2696062 RepID=A0A7X5RKI5_9ALTE|nr:thioredoxin domain-containing protein [Alteromonas profundi]
MKNVSIDIVSDVVCPWCIVGYKKLQQALLMLDEVNATVNFHPFELNPNMPKEGQNLREHIMEKYGASEAQSQQTREQLTDIGASLGFTFDYFDDMKMVNTFNAHQVLHLASLKDKKEALKLRLFAAFFSERKDISDAKVLVEEAVSIGLEKNEVELALAQQTYAEEVRMQDQLWMQRGIQSVPTFVIGNQGIAGAQSPETLAQFIREAMQQQGSGE